MFALIQLMIDIPCFFLENLPLLIISKSQNSTKLLNPCLIQIDAKNDHLATVWVIALSGDHAQATLESHTEIETGATG
jgi:hypothetical protein